MYSLVMLMYNISFAKNTTYDGDYGSATGPMELYWIYVLQTQSQRRFTPKAAGCTSNGCRYRELAASATSWAVTVLVLQTDGLTTMEFKIIIWFITKQLKCGLLL
jgi:hypothetical protein